MSNAIHHIAGTTFHGRKGAIDNAFSYSVDYVLLDAESKSRSPWLFGRNRGNMASLHDSDHGGAPRKGQGAPWAREVLAAHGLGEIANGRLEILAQPRFWGHVFNPVSFWLAYDADDRLRAVIPEVTNTYGDRHSYLCARDDHEPIQRDDILTATKIFHVSPFQTMQGSYTFRFDIRADKIGIWIDLTSGNDGLLATLTGKRTPLTNMSLLRAALRRPLGSRRVLGLIHWQALKLWWKGAKFQTRPEPPSQEVSR